MSIQATAKKYLDQLETKQRDGESIVVLKGTAMDGELQRFIYELHDGMLPKDWIFDQVYHALDLLSDADIDTIEHFEVYIQDVEPDVYTASLNAWMLDFRMQDEVTEAIKGLDFSMDQAIMYVQKQEIDRIYREVFEFVDSNLELNESKNSLCTP